MLKIPLILLFSLLTTFISFSLIANPQLKASSELSTIKLGISNALSGPTSNLGKELNKGATVYFNRLNKLGGVHGRPVEIISLDDGYEPENTVLNTKNLIKQQVLALFGYVGTPTSYAIMPILVKSNIPFLMPFTGADFLRSPTKANIINLRASYYQEIQSQVEYLIRAQEVKNIALVIQADEFGLSAQRAVNQILRDKKLTSLFTVRYRRNSNNMKETLRKLAEQPIDTVIFIGTYQPFIQLINLAHFQGVDVLFSSLSFVGSHNVLDKIPLSSKVILSEVMPAPKDCNWQLCQQFISDMASAGYTELNRVQLEGYLNAFVFSQVAKQCDDNLNRQCLLAQFKQYSFQDNALNINFSNKGNQGNKKVYLSFSDSIKKSILRPAFTH